MGIRHLDDLSPMLFQIIQAVEGLEEGSYEVVFVLGNGSSFMNKIAAARGLRWR